MSVFDWLTGIPLPAGQKAFDMVEVRFKNGRKSYYRNGQLELYVGDVVVIDLNPGLDVGIVSLTGELVKIQLKRKDVKDNYEIKKIIRKANEDDIAKWQAARGQENTTMMGAREVAKQLNLQMKISDVEFQGDGTKAIFYYTADDRVDFRELIRKLAERFKVKIEMKQIGYRAEAGRLGGIGSCGRELCCSTWLTDFRAVSTSAARYQQLSLNPGKLAGQCGKLKCCLNYELDQYVEAVKDLPPTNVKLRLPKGTAYHFKTDIFKKIVYYTLENEPGSAPFALTTEMVFDIIEKNKKGQALEIGEEIYLSDKEKEKEVEVGFAQVVGQDSLTRFDKSKKSKSNNKSRGPQNRGPQAPKGDRKPNENKLGEGKSNEGKTSENKPQGNKPQGPRPQGNKPQGKPQENKTQENKPQNAGGSNANAGNTTSGNPPKKKFNGPRPNKGQNPKPPQSNPPS
jgi:cell fate regulator YaaT (PSP1 superfamily)